MQTSHALILVAGEGKRLFPFTKTNPKCFVTVNNVTILENALNNFLAAGVTKTTILIGHLSQLIKDRIGLNYKGMNIKYIENKIYDSTNSMYSLYLGLQDLKEPTWVLEGDVFFKKSILEKTTKESFSWFADSSIRHLDGAYLKSNKEGRVVSLEIVRDIRNIKENYYKSIGLLHLTIEGISLFKKWLELGIEQQKTNVYYDLIVAEHINEIFIEIIDVKDCKWYEIDTFDDLENARALFTLMNDV